MTNLNANAHAAAFGLTAEPKLWNLSDLEGVEKYEHTVFSCFSCGGGSSMGYKLAGFDVIGNVEIDRKMNALYVKNHKPKYNYHMDVRDFRRLPDQRLPSELFQLDVLDGSPPCSTFSMAGQREAAWGKEKVFREGQKKQTLDDLFFEFIGIAERLKPKIVIAENVKGMLRGNAKGYVNEIVKTFRKIGYDIQIFLLNAAEMGVPQRRERVFFIARRRDLNLPKLKMHFDELPVLFGTVRSEQGIPLREDSKFRDMLRHRKEGDKSISDIYRRLEGRSSGFNNAIADDKSVAPTIVSSGTMMRFCDGCKFSEHDFIACQTFPEDYDFMGANVQYVCGMSVPPYMMQRIAEQVRVQWLAKI